MTGMSNKQKILTIVYALLVTGALYQFFKQAPENVKESSDIRDRVKQAQNAPVPHPLLVSNFRRNVDYVEAINLINQSKYQRIWAVSDFLDPTFNLNYYIYPKQLVMHTEMQDIVNYGRKIMQDDIVNYKPSQYDAVLIVKPGQVSLTEEWE